MVNTYLGVALEFGVVGLTLFIGLFISALVGLRRALRATLSSDTELRTIISALIATIVGVVITIGTVSSISYLPQVYWSLVGLCVAVTRIAQARRTAALSHHFSQTRIAA